MSIAVGWRQGDPVRQAGLYFGVRDSLQLLPHRGGRTDGCQTPRGIVAVHLQVTLNQGVQQSVVVGPQRPWSSRIWPRGLSLSMIQAFIARSRASRETNSICTARTPNSRLRSALGRAGVGSGTGDSSWRRTGTRNAFTFARSTRRSKLSLVATEVTAGSLQRRQWQQ